MVYEYLCTDSKSLVNVSLENSLSLRFYTSFSLKRVKSCKSGNTLQKGYNHQ